MSLAGLLAVAGAGAPAWGQSVLDQASRTLQQRDLAPPPGEPAKPRITVEAAPENQRRPGLDLGGGVMVGAIRVEGAPDIPGEAFAPALEPYLGKVLSNVDLASLSRAIADIARERGLMFATAYVPPQTLALGVLRIQVDEGIIARIQVNGTSNHQVLRILDKLTGHAPSAGETERLIALVSDVPGITVSKISFMRLGEQGMLVVDVHETRTSITLGVDNYGSHELGPVRATAVAEFNSAFTAGDKLTLQALSTPIKPRELAFVALKYDLPLDTDDTVLSGTVTAGRVRPGGALDPFRITGDSREVTFGVRRPLFRSRQASLWLAAKAGYLASREGVLGFDAIDDRMATFSLTLNGNTALLGGRLRADATLTRGFAVLGATRAGDPFSSHPDADANFTKLLLSADWTGNLASWLGARAAIVSQISADPLLSAQQMAIGGPSFGRAYDYSTLAGDYGTLASLELRHDFQRPASWLAWAQPYVFVDGGTVRTIGGGGNSGTLYSGGGGIRAGLGKFSLSVEGAAALDPAGPAAAPKPRVNVQVLRRF